MTSEIEQMLKNIPDTDEEIEEADEMDETIRAILKEVDSCNSLEELKVRLQEMLEKLKNQLQEKFDETEEEEEDK